MSRHAQAWWGSQLSAAADRQEVLLGYYPVLVSLDVGMLKLQRLGVDYLQR